jgi:hypothetical protein
LWKNAKTIQNDVQQTSVRRKIDATKPKKKSPKKPIQQSNRSSLSFHKRKAKARTLLQNINNIIFKKAEIATDLSSFSLPQIVVENKTDLDLPKSDVVVGVL